MATESKTDVPDKDKADFLWRVIGRFDFYINSTNAKAAFLIAFNTFMMGALVTNWSNVLSQFNDHSWAKCVAAVLVFAVIVATIVSLWFTFYVVNPYLSSNKKVGEYQSSIFFADVAEYSDATVYQQKVNGESYKDHLQDLARQAHVLAKGTNGKFLKIKHAITAVVFAQLPALFLLVLLRMIVVFIDISLKVSQ